MKTLTGIMLGMVGYCAWKLSEPSPGESGEPSARVERLKVEWHRALEAGRAAGEARRRRMEADYEVMVQR